MELTSIKNINSQYIFKKQFFMKTFYLHNIVPLLDYYSENSLSDLTVK
jgi:hypothetical protein